jgi:signal transduction histidine kinase
VNHDIKNGLTPIRNVFRHLAQLARERPKQLRGVFEERQATVDSSIAYLEKLASNYARLSPASDRRPIDVNAVVQQAVVGTGGGRAHLRVDLAPGRIKVLADPVALRRILENLVGNAIDSLEAGSGTVSISTQTVTGEGRPVVRIVVADTGCGMSDEQVDQIFEDFYTTKQDGTGLGLSIARRLVMDHDGSIRVESVLGKGSRFIVELPLAGDE